MGSESPLNIEEKTILSHVRRGDPIGLVGMEVHISERTLSRRLEYIRKCINDLT